MLKKNSSILFAAAAAILPVVGASVASAAVSTVSQVYAGGPSGSPYTLNGTVTSILNSSTSANTFILQDGTGSVLAYSIPKTSYTATVGDMVNFTTTDTTYQGSPELTATSFVLNSSSSGTAPGPVVLDIPTFNAAGTTSTQTANPPYAEALVELDNVTFTTAPTSLSTNTTYTITDGTNTTNVYTYKSDSAVVAAVTAANAANPGGFSGTYDIVGYADVYYGAPEIYPTSIIAVPEPASLGLLSLGGLSLLARRRNR